LLLMATGINIVKVVFYFLIVALLWPQTVLSQGITTANRNAMTDSILSGTDSEKVNLLIKQSIKFSRTDILLAIDIAEQADELALDSKIDTLRQKTLMHLGALYFSRGNLDLALSQYIQCLDVQKKTGNAKVLAYINFNIGAIYLELHKYEEAKQFFFRAINYFNKKTSTNKDAKELIMIYNNTGILYENVGNIDSAKYYFNQGLLLARKYNEKIELSKLLNNLGNLCTEFKNNGDGLPYLEEALNIRIECNDNLGIAQSYRNLANYYKSTGDNVNRLKYLKKSYYLSDSVKKLDLSSSIAEKLFSYYREQADPDSALKYHIIFKELSDSINNEKARNDLLKYEIENQYKEKERIRKIEEKRKQLIYLIIGITLILLLAIISLLLRLSRSREKRLKLEQENDKLVTTNLTLEKQQLANELETKNKELTSNVMNLVQKNEFIADLAERLKQLASLNPEKIGNEIKQLIYDLQRNTDETFWKEFELRFQEVHQDFYKRLNEKFSQLTPNEKKLAAFLRLNMSTKEISAITFQSVDSIRIARSRLRKKLELPSEDNLIAFLENF
jgi:tetratricopeptide (TPR) repeat protein